MFLMIDYSQKYFNYLEKWINCKEDNGSVDLEGDKFVINDYKKYINFSSNNYLSLRTNSLFKKKMQYSN